MPDQSEKPRRRLLRLRDYDYARPGAYFVTICAHRRACLFGHIGEGAMRVNALGVLVEACWRALPQHYPHAGLDSFVVMPNHVHGILILADEEAVGRTGPSRHGLSEIVRGFKTFSSRRINELRDRSGTRVWQRGFYEHVIRNEMSLCETRRYIETNPLRWDLDGENPRNACRGGFQTRPYDRIDTDVCAGGFQTRPYDRIDTDVCAGGFQTRPYDRIDTDVCAGGFQTRPYTR